MAKPMNICIRTIQGTDELSQIESRWDSLVTEHGGNPFLLSSFLSSFVSQNKGVGWNPVFVTISSDKSILGVLPLMIKRICGLKFARFILEPSYSPDLIIYSKYRDTFVSLSIDYVFNHLGCQILSLDFDAESCTLRSLMHDSKVLGIHYSYGSEAGHRILPITSTWEEFERLKGGNFRRKFRKIERNLDELGEWKTVYVAGDETGQETFDKLLEVERKSWKERWRAEKRLETDEALTAIWSALNAVRKTQSDLEWGVYFLEVEGHPIAYSLVICHAGVAYITKTSYNTRYRRFYPGIFIVHTAIRQLWDTGMFKLIDFLTDLRFMETWTATVTGRMRMVMSKNPVLPLIFGFFLSDARMRKALDPLIKRILQTILASAQI